MSTRPASSVRSGPSANSSGTKLARPAGFEPTTLGFGGQYSNPLSYGRLGGTRRIISLDARISPPQSKKTLREPARLAFLVHPDAEAARHRGAALIHHPDRRHHPARPA